MRRRFAGNIGVNERTAAHGRALRDGHVRESAKVNPAVFVLWTFVVPNPWVPRRTWITGFVPAPAALQNQYFVTCFREPTRRDCTAKAASDYNDIKAHTISWLVVATVKKL